MSLASSQASGDVQALQYPGLLLRNNEAFSLPKAPWTSLAKMWDDARGKTANLAYRPHVPAAIYIFALSTPTPFYNPLIDPRRIFNMYSR